MKHTMKNSEEKLTTLLAADLAHVTGGISGNVIPTKSTCLPPPPPPKCFTMCLDGKGPDKPTP